MRFGITGRHLLIAFCAFTMAGCASHKSVQDKDEGYDLYLLVGQSNMAGRGKVDSLSKIIHPNIFMLNKSGSWVPATDPMHFDRPKVIGVGPGLSFARAMVERNRKAKIGLIPCAVGGSSISAWKTGAEFLGDHPYDDAISRAKIAMQNGKLKGILWHQGEGDSSEEKSKVYLENLKELIERFRRDLDAPNVPFVAGELGYYRPNYLRVNKVLKDIPLKVPNTAVATAEGLTHNGDGTHLNTESARELGKRFAVQMIKLQSRKRNNNFE